MLRISRGGFDTMITGDVPIETETVLAADYDLADTELFIAGHHGSKHASGDALLDALGAETAVISCGYNTYGHPTQETLDRLKAHGMEIRRTDEDGSVTIRME
jgi:competence protein ComEC